jgi:hypothetical protein
MLEVGTRTEGVCGDYPAEANKAYGATRQDRTGDLLITNQPLYQLS